MAIEFINADLEIYSELSLELIHSEFMSQGYRFAEMYSGKVYGDESFLYSYEVHPDEDRDDHTAEEKIHAFCDSIEVLEGEAKDLWDKATRRVIDLGYQADDECSAFNDLLSLAVIRRMEKLKIEIALTIYPQQIKFA